MDLVEALPARFSQLLLVLLLLLGTTLAFPAQRPAFTRYHPLLYSSSGNESPDSKPPPKKKKKTKGFTINTSLVGSISSDGILSDRRKDQPARAATSSLGVPSKRKKQKAGNNTGKNKPLSKKDRQRTANGSVDSSRQSLIADPENENVQVLEAKRGNKTVTVVRGMTSPMDDRKKLLKEMKRAIGVGGTLVDGVLEIQGPHADKVLMTLKKRGYTRAKKIEA